MEVKKMTKKSIITLSNGTKVELSGNYDFKASYLAWKNKCENISNERILSVGKKTPKPANLYLQLEDHVTDNFVRPNSPNKGKNRGAFKLLKSINDSMTKKGIYTDKDLLEIKGYIRRIKFFSKNNTYNPQNITFTRPKAFTGKGKDIEITNSEQVTIYGHYADDYFKAKYGGKKAPNSWYSSSKNTSKPPLYQALFGGGNLINRNKGLLSVLLEAEAQLKNMKITHLSFQPYRIGRLANIPSLRKFVLGLLKNKDYFRNGVPRYRNIISDLEKNPFVVGGEQNSDGVSESANMGLLPTEIETFSFQKLTPTTVGTLLVAIAKHEVVDGKKVYPLKFGGYLNVRGKTTVPETKKPEVKTKKPEVKKSWIEQLWRD